MQVYKYKIDSEKKAISKEIAQNNSELLIIEICILAVFLQQLYLRLISTSISKKTLKAFSLRNKI